MLLALPALFGCPSVPAGPGAGPPTPSPPCAAKLLVGGTVHLGFHPDDRPVEALGIAADGCVALAGTLAEVRAAACADAEEIDLEGGTAVPGLVDAHGHVGSLGRAMDSADLRGAMTAEEAARRAADWAGALPEGRWALGRGWDQNLWPAAAFPDRAVLDALLPDRPALLVRVDGHAAWVNSAALAAAGIDAGTPEPAGGEILRRPDGEPTGVLVDNAVDLVTARLPVRDAEARRDDIFHALEKLASFGLTAVHDMGAAAEDLPVYRQLAEQGLLPLRVALYLDGTTPLPEGVERSAWGRLEVVGVKGFADGALGSRGALLLADYADEPGHRGLEVASVERLVELGQAAYSRRLALAIHAIGDAGIRNALDAQERLGPPPYGVSRPRIEHVQILAPEDLSRFGALGIVASMQPVHAVSDMGWAEQRVGPARLALAYAWRALANSGARLAFGTDFPVESPDPFATLAAAVTRRDAAGLPEGGWHPEQCLRVPEALEAMTWGAAYAVDADTSRGRLVPGLEADITVLDRDPLAVPDTAELRSIRPTMTVVGGEVRRLSPDR
ncbi:MAG: amidohydrolase [Deltaproteobacteria bacterium]|nr:amidohydrolase [Deltaproteobacteria bacterium]